MPPHVVEAIVNHISGVKAGVAGVYNRAALNAWAKYVGRLEARLTSQPERNYCSPATLESNRALALLRHLTSSNERSNIAGVFLVGACNEIDSICDGCACWVDHGRDGSGRRSSIAGGIHL